jgi:hypothetical protein
LIKKEVQTEIEKNISQSENKETKVHTRIIRERITNKKK